MTWIGEKAFEGCTGLTEVHLKHERPIFFYDSFADLDLSKITLYIPKESEDFYEDHPLYSQFGKIVTE